MTLPLIRSALAIATTALLAACGGGGNNSNTGTPPVNGNPPPPAVVTVTLGGVAATGAPVANGNVTARCASGNDVSGTTDVHGAWSLTLAEQPFPCLVTVSGGSLASGVALHSAALDASALNVTPLTALVTAAALKAAVNEKPAVTTALRATLDAALARVNASLAAAGYTPIAGDPLTVAFQPQEGDAHDDLIAKLMRSLADEDQTLAQLATAFATSSDAVAIPNTHVFKAAELAAMPQLNKASLVVDGPVLKMKLEEGLAATPGSFVGGGRGNKAVLQLPGLAGTKLKDLKDVTMELSGPSTASSGSVTKNVYAYMNFTVDLRCSATLLPSTATIQDYRDRYRIFIFDPFVNFIQNHQLISATELSKINYGRSTPGWRVSAGEFVGTGVLVGSNYLGSETLSTFDFDRFPEACIVDAATADGGMLRDRGADAACATDSALVAGDPGICGRKYSGAIVVLGDSGTEVPVEWKLKKVRMNVAQPRNFVFQ